MTRNQHVDSAKAYIGVLAALLCLTVLTTLTAYIDLGAFSVGAFSVVAALTIAVCKAILVALFFMHLRYSNKLTKLVVAGGLMWLGILLVLTLADFTTRGWLGTPGK